MMFIHFCELPAAESIPKVGHIMGAVDSYWVTSDVIDSLSNMFFCDVIIAKQTW